METFIIQNWQNQPKLSFLANKSQIHMIEKLPGEFSIWQRPQEKLKYPIKIHFILKNDNFSTETANQTIQVHKQR